MNRQELVLTKLKKDIEAKVGREMKTPKDFNFLSQCIFDKLHQTVSPTTLKRIWGYLTSYKSPSHTTLNILAQFAGYDSWVSFYQQTEPPSTDIETAQTAVSEDSVEQPVEQPKKIEPAKGAMIVTLLLLAIVGTSWFMTKHTAAGTKHTILKMGQTFKTYHDYLSLFAIKDTTSYWGKPLPRHPFIILWGPEYHHPHWYNDGNKDSLMPTITERWTSPDVDSLTIAVRNIDQLYMYSRMNEIRITFMKDFVDSSYTFLGIYRLDREQSDRTQRVWERIATECDLGNLDYLEELRY